MSLLSEINLIENKKIATCDELDKITYIENIKPKSLFDYTNYQWLSDWFRSNTNYNREYDISILSKEHIINFIKYCKSDNIYNIMGESFMKWEFVYKTKENYINDIINKFSKLLKFDFNNCTIYYEEF